ncbi:MAG: hypothetical protein ABL958_05955 [Bdellovibrionia bacterium]
MEVFQSLSHHFVEVLVVFGRALHFPTMMGMFIFGVIARWLLYRTVKRHYWFAREFEGRVTTFLHKENAQKSTNISFYVLTKKLLERAYFEVFAKREQDRRSKTDTVMLGDDRFFLTKFGCAWFVKELLKQIRFLQWGSASPKLSNITRTVLSKNPAFSRVLGFVPVTGLNDLLNILPGLFVIGGIFGTFLGVMNGLPELSGMDLNDPEKTKKIMDTFLADIAISMGASVLGIFLSVCMTLVNTAWSPERVGDEMVDRFENALDLLWNYATNNEVPSGMRPFNDNADPIEALAEATVSQEYDRSIGKFEDKPKSA